MTACDILLLLRSRNLYHIIDQILDQLGAVSLISLSLSSSSHYHLVSSNRDSRQKISDWKRWMRRSPTSSTLFNRKGSTLVTSLAIFGNSVAFTQMDFEESSSCIAVMDIEGEDPPTRLLVADYPVTIHSLDFNEEFLVLLRAEFDSHNYSQGSVLVYSRNNSKICELNPEPDCKITCIKLMGGLAITSSELGSIVLTSLHSQPATTRQIKASDAAVVDLSISENRIVSLSLDSMIRVWTPESDRYLSCLRLENKVSSKISVSWPYCIVTNSNHVILCDLERRDCLQRLRIPGEGPDSSTYQGALAINSQNILVGGLGGTLYVWSLQDIIDGHKPQERITMKTLKCLDMEDVISGVRTAENDKILLSGWNGKCCLLSF